MWPKLKIQNYGFDKITTFRANMHGKTGADWDSAPEEAGTLLTMQS